MNQILANKTILLTRKIEDSPKEFLMMQLYGAKVIAFPAIKVECLECKEELAQLADIDFINFSSVNGVKCFLKNLGNNERLISSNTKVVAVGEKTADACKENGILPEVLPDSFSAKGLLKLYSEMNVAGKKILLPSSTKGRKELPEGLQKLGAKIIQIPVYSTEANETENLSAEIEKLKTGVDLFAFTSPSNFKGFLKINSITNPEKYFADSIVAAIGETTKSAISEFNVDVKIMPDIFTVDKLVQAIVRYFENQE
ncbi:MAG: uroporphyrinogen-III synthase [Rhodothermaceae bacterium]